MGASLQLPRVRLVARARESREKRPARLRNTLRSTEHALLRNRDVVFPPPAELPNRVYLGRERRPSLSPAAKESPLIIHTGPLAQRPTGFATKLGPFGVAIFQSSE